MKYTSLTLTIVLLSAFGCNNKLSKYRSQVNTTKTLIDYITVNDTTAVKKMIGENSIEWGFENDEIILSISVINKQLQKATVVNTKKYKFSEYPENSPNLVDVIVSFEELNMKDKYIMVSFVKFIEEGKILKFELVNPFFQPMDSAVPPFSWE